MARWEYAYDDPRLMRSGKGAVDYDPYHVLSRAWQDNPEPPDYYPEDYRPLTEEEQAALDAEIAAVDAAVWDARYAEMAEQAAQPAVDFRGYTDDDPPF